MKSHQPRSLVPALAPGGLILTWGQRRILERIRVDGVGCWLWRGSITGTGYGTIYLPRPVGQPFGARAHRFSYEQFVGPIPDGLELDHLCRVRHCVNPQHLEPVTRHENIVRGIGPRLTILRQAGVYRTHCRRGHELAGRNVYAYGGKRQCAVCCRDGARAKYVPRRRLDVATHCPRGHLWDRTDCRPKVCWTCERQRNRLRRVLTAIACLLLVACSDRSSSAAPSSIVLIIADDLAVRDLPLAMPRVTELAAQGVQFDAAFTPLPLCGPSRISLLTGKLPRTHGFRSNDPTGFDASDTIATRLHASGYATTIAGKLLNQHWKATHPEAGWDTYLPFRRHDDYGPEQSDVLKGQALSAMAGPAPFFVYVGAVAPHGPLPGPERCQAQPIRERPPTVTEKRWSQRMSALCGLDDLVASIVEARGPDTYVVLTSDNGWMYGEGGRTGKSELVLDAAQIPLIVWGPDVVPAHRREMVSLVDISATVLRLANVGRDGVEGQSFLPLLRDQDAARWVGRLEIEGQ